MANSVSTYGQFLREGERFVQGVAANVEELPHLEMFREELQELVAAVRDLAVRQGALAAEKQTVTRQLQEAFQKGTGLLSFMRRGVQQTYGTRSEKLVEFGLVPLRDRARRAGQPASSERQAPQRPMVE